MQKLLLPLLLLLSTALCSQELVITEFMYNSPGEDLEFIELYNNSSEDINLDGYTFAEGIEYAFGSKILAPSEILLITNDSLKFQRFYSLSAYKWNSGSLRNSGERIAVTNSTQDTIINFEYSDNEPWSKAADGGGASLELCDASSDPSDPANWQRSLEPTFWIEEGVRINASPGRYFGCTLMGETSLTSEEIFFSLAEKTDTIDLRFYLDNPPDTSLIVTIFPSLDGTAIEGVDFELLRDTIEFKPSVNSSEAFRLVIMDDEELDGNKVISLSISPSGLGQSDNVIRITVIDNEGPLSEKLQLRGVIHSEEIKAVELYVKEEITATEILNYSLGSANNGGGSDGQEFLISGMVEPGDCLYITNDTIRFKHFFGQIDNSLLIQDEELEADYNGDDAIELFEKCQLIDVFGYQEIDGTGTEWEHRLGWAKRKDANLTSSTLFDPSAWDYSGVGALQNSDTNAAAMTPYPMSCTPHISATFDSEVRPISIYPNPSSGILWLESDKLIEDIQVIDMLGNIIYSTSSSSRTIRLDISAYPSGMFLIGYSQGGQRYVEQVIIE